MPVTPNCYECKWQRPIQGDAHSYCAHPFVAGYAEHLLGKILIGLVSHKRHLVELEDYMKQPGLVRMGISCDPVGFKNGWFNWPFGYDPVWLRSCNGFEPKNPTTAK